MAFPFPYFSSSMRSAKAILTVWLWAASCLAWAMIAAPTASGQQSSEIFPGLASTGGSPASSGQWTASTGRWQAVRRTDFEQSPSATGTAVEPEATFPQIKNPLQSPQFEEPQTQATLVPQSDGSLQACPECGAAMETPAAGLCGRCLHSGGRLFRLLDLRRWLHIDGEVRTQREPWLFRPFSAGLFMGPVVGSPLINDYIQQGTGFLAGARFGYDFDEDWGLEMRLASASIPVEGGYPPSVQNSADHFLWDIDFLYYPWGDAAVRPYVLMGIGTSRIKFADPEGIQYARILAGMPFGIGIKWKLSDWFIFRLECLDNVAFAGGSIFQTQHNPSITAGLEVRFGRPRVHYWPWEPDMRQ